MITKQRQSNKKTVAQYLSNQILMSGKSQKDIAAEVGYNKPNIITMMKQGATKVPLDKVPLFAKALEVDPVHFLRIALQEYAPETWAVIENLLGNNLLTEHEAQIIQTVRSAADGFDVAPKTEEDRNELMILIQKWRLRDENLENAAAKAKH